MSYDYSHIYDEIVKNGAVVIDPVKGRDGLWGMTFAVGNKYYYIPFDEMWVSFRDKLLATNVDIAVWDLRRIIDWPLSGDRLIWDIKSMWGGDMNLPALVRSLNSTFSDKHPVLDRYLEIDQKVIAHTRALKATHINMPTTMAIPSTLLADWVHARSAVLQDVCHQAFASASASCDDYRSRWRFILQLRRMERTGIAVDLPFVEEHLNGDIDPATGKALRSLQGLYRDGLVTTLLNPMGAKTGRLRHEGGFNTLGVPHGPAREAIVSRWPDGQIYTFDFNAIDYRCIVRAVGGEIARLYEAAQDFHERTASFIFKQVTPYRRTGMKYLSYVYIYGGSDETIVERTGWSMQQVQDATKLLDRKIGPIKEFREKLWMEGTESGVIKIPGGRDVVIQKDDSPGKVIGLFAQSYSAWVFEQAFVKVMEYIQDNQSKVIFAVHDELVIDVHPDEIGLMENVLRVMQHDDNVIKMRKGPNYGRQTD